jgi:hypothetical protein
MAVTAIPTAPAMIAVASQPMICRLPTTVNLPTIALFEVISTIIAITGTANTPLITALKKSALIGSSGKKLIAGPGKSCNDDCHVEGLCLQWLPRQSNRPSSGLAKGVRR